MTAGTPLLAHGDEAVQRPRHGAAREQEVAVGVPAHPAEAELREAARARVTRHALPLDDARRVGARGDRAGLAVARVAVRLGTAAEVVAVHHALEAPAFRHARH